MLFRSSPDHELQITRTGSNTGHSSGQPPASLELEAVVSCTSDGLIVVLRKSRPPIPGLKPPERNMDFANEDVVSSASSSGQRPASSQGLSDETGPYMLPQQGPQAPEAPSYEQLMKSVHDFATLAWGLAGIMGNAVSHNPGVFLAERHTQGVWSQNPYHKHGNENCIQQPGACASWRRPRGQPGLDGSTTQQNRLPSQIQHDIHGSRLPEISSLQSRCQPAMNLSPWGDHDMDIRATTQQRPPVLGFPHSPMPWAQNYIFSRDTEHSYYGASVLDGSQSNQHRGY